MAESINAAIRRHQRLAKQHQDIRDNLLKKATWCPKCGAYYETDKCGDDWKSRYQRGVVIHADAGYGDDDELADVTYSEHWKICPKGHPMKMVDRLTTKVENKRYRT